MSDSYFDPWKKKRTLEHLQHLVENLLSMYVLCLRDMPKFKSFLKS